MKSKLALLLIVITLVYLGYALYTLRSEGNQCVREPFQYAVDKLAKTSDKEVICALIGQKLNCNMDGFNTVVFEGRP